MKILYATFNRPKNSSDWRYFGQDEYHSVNENDNPEEIIKELNKSSDWKYVLLEVKPEIPKIFA